MYWRNVHSDVPGGTWAGLDAYVDKPAPAPRLRVEAGSGRLIRLVAGDWPILWARIADDYWGYWYLRANLAGGPGLALPPISAAEARSTTRADCGTATWFADWARRFATDLAQSSMSPLYAGRWRLAPCQERPSPAQPRSGIDIPPTGSLQSILGQPDHAFSEWDLGDVLLPLVLRNPASDEAARVKALRKLARDGELPPLLLMWISGLDRYVLLDGHDRLHAAVLEGATPQALALVALREEPPMDSAARQVEANRIAAALEHAGSGRSRSVDGINRVLIEAFDDRHLNLKTRAWPLAGGSASWRKQVSSLLSRISNADSNMLP